MIKTDLKAREELLEALTRLGKVNPKASHPDPEVIQLLRSVMTKNPEFGESVADWLNTLDNAADEEGFNPAASELHFLGNATAELLHKADAYRNAIGIPKPTHQPV